MKQGRVWLIGGLGQWFANAGNVQEFSALAGISRFTRNFGGVLSFGIPTRSTWAALKEMRNKIEAFALFASVGRQISSGACRRFGLRAAVPNLLKLEPYIRLWRTEGLGYYYAAEVLNGCPDPCDLLSANSLFAVPKHFIIPLHTGMGLALACHHMRSMDANAPRAAVVDFLRACRMNSVAGYEGSAIEALGLVAQLLYPKVVFNIDRELSEIDQASRERFWHGVGRGLYFSPANVLPCISLIWPSIAAARSKPPDEQGRRNAVAGLAWAVTLVNIQHPDVIELFLERHGETINDDSFANGVTSALAVWSDWAPETRFPQDLCEFEPRNRQTRFCELWHQNVRTHCGHGAAEMHANLKHSAQPDELFRYRPILSIARMSS